MFKKGTISMCTYCGTNKYRKIYENHVGPIPKDATGRRYHIHHKDGNRKNNSIDNLVALSIQDHYDIHYQQGDYSSCWLLGKRMKNSFHEQSELMKKSALLRVKTNTHPFQKREDGSSLASDMVKTGTHPLQRRKDGSSSSMDRIKNGTNPFCRRADGSTISSDMVKAGTHPFLNKRFTGETHSHYDPTLYTFVNNDGRIEKNITRHDMRKKYNLNIGNFSSMMTGRYKSIKGWRLTTAE
jgi:hypothetical protein